MASRHSWSVRFAPIGLWLGIEPARTSYWMSSLSSTIRAGSDPESSLVPGAVRLVVAGAPFRSVALAGIVTGSRAAGSIDVAGWMAGARIGAGGEFRFA